MPLPVAKHNRPYPGLHRLSVAPR
ncbi:MAG: hypothetical protein JWN43_1575, partial [Gammaproteobacteria bacterium]|nr:hypothetical protein [Gammaproteobacteria bacterium]